ncbi:MAG: MFS transporter [Alphaproteobacteria bacterium]|nr:MFS transporter [Alphaproteobacteria bacterium]
MTPVRLSIVAIVLSVGCIQGGNGILGTLLPLALDQAGYPVSAVGLLVTGHAIGFMAGSFTGGQLIREFGLTRAFIGFAALAAVSTISFALATDPWLWGVLRAVVGFGLAGLFVIAESWLNQATDNVHRGSLMGFYQLTQKVAYAIGQAAIATDASDLLFFAVATAAFAASAVPVATASGARPPAPRLARISMWTVFRRVPSAAAGCFAAGLINNPVAGMAPIFGTGIGLSPARSAILVATMQLGSLFVQWPMALYSDRLDRRWVMLGCAATASAASVGIATVGVHVQWVLYVLFALWGAAALSTYAICVAQANDRAPRGAAVAISGSLQLLWSMGSVTGPLLATAVIGWLGPAGLFVYGAALAAVLALFIGWRLHVRPPSLPVPTHVQRDHL